MHFYNMHFSPAVLLMCKHAHTCTHVPDAHKYQHMYAEAAMQNSTGLFRQQAQVHPTRLCSWIGVSRSIPPLPRYIHTFSKPLSNTLIRSSNSFHANTIIIMSASCQTGSPCLFHAKMHTHTHTHTST